jgi:aminocarboxymuconate-semialdehyde decarboxylase
MRIDIHTHILPKTWPDLRERYGYGGWIRLEHVQEGKANMMMDDRFFRSIDANCWDPTARFIECDRDSVDVQVLSTVPVMFGYWAKSEDTLDLCQILNDDIQGHIESHPKRIAGLASLPMQHPGFAVQELERCMTKLSMRGVQIGSHINKWNLDDDQLIPFWEAAEDLGAAVFVHPWDMMGMDRMPRHWLPWLVGMPAETALAMCSVMMGGILDRFPKLRIMFAHGGGSFPGTVGRIDHGFRVRPDLCQTHTQKLPSSYVDKVYIDTAVHDDRSLRLVLDVFGAERIAMGSDYPFPLGEWVPGKLVDDANLPAETKDRLLCGTALEWLGMTKEDFQTGA